MSEQNEKLGDVQGDESNCQTAMLSGATAQSNPTLAENFNQDSLERNCNSMEMSVDESDELELTKAKESLKNMAIAHEIAVNENFKIEKYEPKDDALYGKVKEILYKAYWDILARELSRKPPVYTQALHLLEEIKQIFNELLLPHSVKTRENMNEVLDIALIKEQAERGVLDFSYYARYVINLMSKLCAPIRDERIAELKKCTDVIETFKGVMEVLELMKLDLTNFTISLFRPSIAASGVEYEKYKFDEYIKVQEDGLKNTKQWLSGYLTEETLRAVSSEATLNTSPSPTKRLIDTVLTEAYLDLLEVELPDIAETLMLDQVRIIELYHKRFRLTVTASILSMLSATCPLTLEHLSTIKQHLDVLLDSIHCNKDLEDISPNVFLQLKADIEKVQGDRAKSIECSDETKVMAILESLLSELPRADNRIRQSISSKIRAFVKNAIVSKSVDPAQIPSALCLVEKELISIAKQFLMLTTRNRCTFDEYYENIISEFMKDKHSDSMSVH